MQPGCQPFRPFGQLGAADILVFNEKTRVEDEVQPASNIRAELFVTFNVCNGRGPGVAADSGLGLERAQKVPRGVPADRRTGEAKQLG